ncbi:MAG: DUF1501 domain-containing protein [Verrucomicrobiaceae bacterium]|nr:DUF1501 domain-containing protein [Verrucomicrobiaceae bacterium]
MKPLPAIGWLVLFTHASDALAGSVNFAHDIKPLLNKHCTACHGGVKQASNLSLVYHSKVLEPAKSGKIPVVPGNLDKSELIARIISIDDDEVMPPPKHGKRLPERDNDLRPRQRERQHSRFVVLLSGGQNPDAGKAAWGSGFLPSVYQGVQCRSEGDPC